MKKAAFITLLFIVGAFVGGFLALYAVLPSGTVECGDACVNVRGTLWCCRRIAIGDSWRGYGEQETGKMIHYTMTVIVIAHATT